MHNLVADDLAEAIYGKEFYDLTQKQQMKLYDEAYKRYENKDLVTTTPRFTWRTR